MKRFVATCFVAALAGCGPAPQIIAGLIAAKQVADEVRGISQDVIAEVALACQLVPKAKTAVAKAVVAGRVSYPAAASWKSYLDGVCGNVGSANPTIDAHTPMWIVDNVNSMLEQ